MSVYQVFNPITGTHIQCENETTAKNQALLIMQQIVNQAVPHVVREDQQENGDVTWIPVKILPPVKVFYSE